MVQKIYLDYNATVPMRAGARDAVLRAMDAPHNASSVHGFGRAARKIVEDARLKVAALVNANAAQVIFNSGATEGNNTVLKFFSGERVLISAIEHPSVSAVLLESEKIPVTKDGVVDLGALEKMLKVQKTGLVAVMYVNNETGAIQPVRDIAALAHNHGALFHCDAVQAAGKIAIDMAPDGIDFLTLSAHKIGGPQGVGALALGLCGIAPVLLEGGGQEKKTRAGTENAAGIAGFGAAAEEAREDLKEFQELSILRDRLEKEIHKISPEVVIHAQNSPRVAGTCFFSLPGASAETLLMALDLEGVCVSNGSACSSGTVKASSVLHAMGYGDDIARAALRVSMGWNTKPGDIDRFLEIWSKISARIQTKAKTHA
ncbi:MAG: cysteine desulfurase family protein [Alphaproteobacteria bacterium]